MSDPHERDWFFVLVYRSQECRGRGLHRFLIRYHHHQAFFPRFIVSSYPPPGPPSSVISECDLFSMDVKDPPSARPPGPKRSPSAPSGPRIRSVSPISQPLLSRERVDRESSSIIDYGSGASDNLRHHREPGPPGLQHQDHILLSWSRPYPAPATPPLPGCHCGHPYDPHCHGCAEAQQCCSCYRLPHHDCQALNRRLMNASTGTAAAFTTKQPAAHYRGGQPSPTPTEGSNDQENDGPLRSAPQSPSRDVFTSMPLPTTLPPTPEARYSASIQRAWASPIPTSQPQADIEIPLYTLPQAAALPVTPPKAFRNVDLEKTPRSPRPPPVTRHEPYARDPANKRTYEARFKERASRSISRVGRSLTRRRDVSNSRISVPPSPNSLVQPLNIHASAVHVTAHIMTDLTPPPEDATAEENHFFYLQTMGEALKSEKTKVTMHDECPYHIERREVPAIGEDDAPYVITAMEAAQTMVNLLGPNGFEWKALGALIVCASLLAPISGSLKDFDTFLSALSVPARYNSVISKKIETISRVAVTNEDLTAKYLAKGVRLQEDLKRAGQDKQRLQEDLKSAIGDGLVFRDDTKRERAKKEELRAKLTEFQNENAHLVEMFTAASAEREAMFGQLGELQSAMDEDPDTPNAIMAERLKKMLAVNEAQTKEISQLRKQLENLSKARPIAPPLPLSSAFPPTTPLPSAPAPVPNPQPASLRPAFPPDFQDTKPTRATNAKKKEKKKTTAQLYREQGLAFVKARSLVKEIAPSLTEDDANGMAMHIAGLTKDAATPHRPTTQPAQEAGWTTVSRSKGGPATTLSELEKKVTSTWRQLETKRSLVHKPTDKGTSRTELHLRLPKDSPAAALSSAHGTDLLNKIADLVHPNLNDDEMAIAAMNPLIAARWLVNQNLILRFHGEVTEEIKNYFAGACEPVKPQHRDPTASPDVSQESIQVLNKPPTTVLKFSAVPTLHPNGATVTDRDLLNDIMASPFWSNVCLWTPPKFLTRPGADLQATEMVVVSVLDDDTGSVGKGLMGKQVRFSQSYTRTCFRWVAKQVVSLCATCQQWGHHAARCRTNRMICSKCAGSHPVKNHEQFCDLCKTGNGHACQPKCANCDGNHSTTNSACPFWAQRFNYEGIQELLRKRRDDRIAAKTGKRPAPQQKASKPTGALLSDIAKGKRPERGNNRVGPSGMGFAKPLPPNALLGPLLPPKPAFVQTHITFSQTLKSTNEGSRITEVTNDSSQVQGVESSIHAPQSGDSADEDLEYCTE